MKFSDRYERKDRSVDEKGGLLIFSTKPKPRCADTINAWDITLQRDKMADGAAEV